METLAAPKHLHQDQQQPPLPPLTPTTTRPEPGNSAYPTTFVQADPSSFKQVVQMLTGSGSAKPEPPKPHLIPPIKSLPKKPGSGSGFKLYERRNSAKLLKINPLVQLQHQPGSGFSPRNPEVLSPSILDFPALVLSPVTPLIHDPFTRSGTGPNSLSSPGEGVLSPELDSEAEEKAIREKGFFLHPSPASTPRNSEAPPRLLPLFPVTSPRVSGSGSGSGSGSSSTSSNTSD